MSNPADACAEAEAFMQEREARPAHVRHVAHLALEMFDALAGLHGLGPHERLLLEAASLLHDIGHRAIGQPPLEGHHLESARQIRQHNWLHFAPEQVEIIAQTARYHRKNIPELTDAEFRALGEWDRRTVQHLAALLRLADAFDRSHQQLIQRVRVDIHPNQLVFHVEATAPVPRELQSAQQKGDLAQAMFQRDVAFVEEGPPSALSQSGS